MKHLYIALGIVVMMGSMAIGVGGQTKQTKPSTLSMPTTMTATSSPIQKYVYQNWDCNIPCPDGGLCQCKSSVPPSVYESEAVKTTEEIPEEERSVCGPAPYDPRTGSVLFVCTPPATTRTVYKCHSVKGYRTFKLEDDSGEMRCLHIPKKESR